MSGTLDPEESGRKAAAVASRELPMGGSHRNEEAIEKSCFSTVVAAGWWGGGVVLWLMFPEFPTMACGTLVNPGGTLISSCEDAGDGFQSLIAPFTVRHADGEAVFASCEETEEFVLRLCKQARPYPD